MDSLHAWGTGSELVDSLATVARARDKFFIHLEKFRRYEPLCNCRERGTLSHLAIRSGPYSPMPTVEKRPPGVLIHFSAHAEFHCNHLL